MFQLLIIDHVCGCDDKNPCYAVLGKYPTRQAAQRGKESYSFARSGVVNRMKVLAEAAGLRSPFKIEEIK